MIKTDPPPCTRGSIVVVIVIPTNPYESQNQRNSKPPRRYNETHSNQESLPKYFFPKSQIWVSLTSKTQDQATVRVGNDQNRPPPCTRGSVVVVVIPANPYESQNNEIPNRRGGTMKHFLTRNPYQSKINEIPNRRGGTMKHILTRNRYRNTFPQNLRFGSP